MKEYRPAQSIHERNRRSACIVRTPKQHQIKTKKNKNIRATLDRPVLCLCRAQKREIRYIFLFLQSHGHGLIHPSPPFMSIAHFMLYGFHSTHIISEDMIMFVLIPFLCQLLLANRSIPYLRGLFSSGKEQFIRFTELNVRHSGNVVLLFDKIIFFD